MLSKFDGNDISLKNFSIATGTVSARQIDKFGEKIQSSSTTITTGKHIISGGQIELRSPDTFSLTYNGATQSSTASSFDDGFVKKSNNLKSSLFIFLAGAGFKIVRQSLSLAFFKAYIVVESGVSI